MDAYKLFTTHSHNCMLFLRTHVVNVNPFYCRCGLTISKTTSNFKSMKNTVIKKTVAASILRIITFMAINNILCDHFESLCLCDTFFNEGAIVM